MASASLSLIEDAILSVREATASWQTTLDDHNPTREEHRRARFNEIRVALERIMDELLKITNRYYHPTDRQGLLPLLSHGHGTVAKIMAQGFLNCVKSIISSILDVETLLRHVASLKDSTTTTATVTTTTITMTIVKAMSESAKVWVESNVKPIEAFKGMLEMAVGGPSSMTTMVDPRDAAEFSSTMSALARLLLDLSRGLAATIGAACANANTNMARREGPKSGAEAVAADSTKCVRATGLLSRSEKADGPRRLDSSRKCEADIADPSETETSPPDRGGAKTPRGTSSGSGSGSTEKSGLAYRDARNEKRHFHRAKDSLNLTYKFPPRSRNTNHQIASDRVQLRHPAASLSQKQCRKAATATQDSPHGLKPSHPSHTGTRPAATRNRRRRNAITSPPSTLRAGAKPKPRSRIEKHQRHPHYPFNNNTRPLPSHPDERRPPSSYFAPNLADPKAEAARPTGRASSRILPGGYDRAVPPAHHGLGRPRPHQDYEHVMLASQRRPQPMVSAFAMQEYVRSVPSEWLIMELQTREQRVAKMKSVADWAAQV